jgi:hypothetical protein
LIHYKTQKSIDNPPDNKIKNIIHQLRKIYIHLNIHYLEPEATLFFAPFIGVQQKKSSGKPRRFLFLGQTGTFQSELRM